ncbi:L-serine ammonia-lyase, iron-sulfur-dependent, subunit alpha [Eggerthella lenta]|uniref:L-serine ammonia-lyase, iron-sulfur-dependent, subunit alpha n=1 Tax=Eggerthella lenta TaxID=84112 RepID=UPI0012ECD162|nr:L-serine ammonia-lyase, iron-sulfur-dependent, subunit alpha [Eggerthella lenta]MVM49884.1 L-serine ammonia-lyase, iron-sulfur-dependent, subunit alpha [Eggerthella lenta]MVN30367.1 L-serine ammonia-lyase, iron-sulfur-dependent, subunit alpha [Eggerthella lenta]MVN35406.1 L-serine ammonia-lyase, iron-sulfur-dependent, subunit alpha [Eggerthella lenta]
MKTLGLTDVIGPIMVGPSSSHTAGALRIAYMARRLCLAEPKTVEFRLLGSFAHTLTGHGTDKALVAGMLGLATDDLRIRDSFDLAREAGLAFSFVTLPDAEYDHPNTIDVRIVDAAGNAMDVRGESIGGGAAVIRKIDDIDVRITGESASIVVRQRDEKGVLAHIAQSISDEGVNIATTRMYRERKGDTAYTVLETDQAVGAEAKAAIEDHPAIYDVRIIPGDARADVERVAVPDVAAALQRFAELDFGNGAALLAYCEEHGATLSEAFLAREAALAASLGYADGAAAYLREALAVMRCAARRPIDEALPSMGGLIGGEARKLADLHERGGELCDDQLSCAIAYAMAVLETNASMGRIVAAPTAGSAGVLPGVLLALQRTRGYGDDDLAHGLAAAAAIGYLITRNATVSGAEGGCQAEVGSAAAMAAAASVELMGGTPAQCFAAASNALTNMMGLVCDPIAGLVEEPCQKRNAAGAAVALVSAQIALAGIGNLVDFDQTVEAMRKVGRTLPFELRESALGGIAAAPTACAYCPGCN